MAKALPTSPLIISITIIILLFASCSYRAVASSAEEVAGGGEEGFSGGSEGEGEGEGDGEGTFSGGWSSTSGSNQGSCNGDDGDDMGGDLKFSRSTTILLSVFGGLSLIAILHCLCCCNKDSSLQGTQQQTGAIKEPVQQASVIKLQVALNGTARSLQSDLSTIARRAEDTSTRRGYKYILEESAKALLRNSDYWLSFYLSVELKIDSNQARNRFLRVLYEERCKFDEETLTNTDNCKRESIGTGASNSTNPFILVSIILATTELLQLQSVNTADDLQRVIQMLRAVSKNGIVAAHVSWTPQKENNCLTKERLLQDYPLLRHLNKEVKLTID